MFRNLRSKLSHAWVWIACVALAVFAGLGSLAASRALDRRAEVLRARQREARLRKEAEAIVSDATLRVLLARADAERDAAVKAGEDIERTFDEHSRRVRDLRRMSPAELAAEASRQAAKSRASKRHLRLLKVAFVGLVLASSKAYAVDVPADDLAQLIADSEALIQVEEASARLAGRCESESVVLRDAVAATTLATRQAVNRAMRAEMQADADRLTAERAKKRARWWGGSGVVVGALFTLLLAWGVQ